MEGIGDDQDFAAFELSLGECFSGGLDHIAVLLQYVRKSTEPAFTGMEICMTLIDQYNRTLSRGKSRVKDGRTEQRVRHLLGKAVQPKSRQEKTKQYCAHFFHSCVKIKQNSHFLTFFIKTTSEPREIAFKASLHVH